MAIDVCRASLSRNTDIPLLPIPRGPCVSPLFIVCNNSIPLASTSFHSLRFSTSHTLSFLPFLVMIKSNCERPISVLWAIFCVLCFILATQNSFVTAATTAVTLSLSSTEGTPSLGLCQQCLAQGILTIPACSIAATAPAFSETETDPIKIQVFKNLYPMAVECLCIANATAITTTTEVVGVSGQGAIAIRGWTAVCNDQCSISMVSAQVRTLAVLSNLMGCNGPLPDLGHGGSTSTATPSATRAIKTTTTVAVPKASLQPSNSVGRKSIGIRSTGSKKVLKKSNLAPL